MKFLLLLMLFATILIIVGKLFKWATLYFFISFTYLWLLDKGYYNNHYYFISLLTFLLLFTDADAWGSLKNRKSKITIPYYQVFIVKMQILLVFLIAGINKLNYYWLFKFQPMKHILETKAERDNYQWLVNEGVFAFFSWSGALFDVLIGFMLWIPRFRIVGIISFVLFNLNNYWLFHDIGEIGFFPLILLACLTIFFDSNLVEYRLKWLAPKALKVKAEAIKETKTSQSLILFVLTLFIIIQCILPFRYLLYQDHVDWTGKGQRFSWRMKIMYKDVDMQFYLVEKGKEERIGVNVGYFLNDKQYTNLMYYPDFIPVVAQYIKKEGEKRGLNSPKVVADFWVGFNGEDRRRLVSPDVDLSSVDYNPFKNSEWILPLTD